MGPLAGAEALPLHGGGLAYSIPIQGPVLDGLDRREGCCWESEEGRKEGLTHSSKGEPGRLHKEGAF